MPLCTLHERLLQDERNAWAAFHNLKDSDSSDEKELERRYRNACNASTTESASEELPRVCDGHASTRN